MYSKKKLVISLFICLNIFYSSKVNSQILSHTDSVSTLKNLFKKFHWFRERIHRIDNEKRWKYYLSGNEYEIEINYFTTKDLVFSTQKGMIKIFSGGLEKKSERANTDVAEFPLPNKIFYFSGKIDSISVFSTQYFVSDFTGTGVYNINMLNYTTRDSILERDIVLSILKDGIKDSFFLAPGPNMIDFAGRIITVDRNFQWMGPNNIYCPEYGQMNWSEHSSNDLALRARNLQLIKNNNAKIVDVLKTDTIQVLFEDSKQEALRVTYKSKIPRIFWGKGSKILIVYYIVAPVRGQFVHCVLSHYEDQWLNGNVPPPLNSVMSLKIPHLTLNR